MKSARLVAEIVVLLWGLLLGACHRPQPRVSLCDAAAQGDLATVKYHFEQDPKFIKQRDPLGRLPLTEAAKAGQLQVVKFLFEQRVYLSDLDKEGLTALHWAVKMNRPEVVSFLIQKNPGLIDQKDKNHHSPLELAVEVDNRELLQSLLKVRCPEYFSTDPPHCFSTPLMAAARTGRLEIAKMLLDKGARVQGRHPNDDTPLHVAAENGRLDVAKLLLERGADLNALQQLQLTPLHFAVRGGQKEMAAFLISKGAKIDSGDIFSSALGLAISMDEPELVKMLLEAGAPLAGASQESRFRDPICQAIFLGHTSIVNLLLQKGAKVDQVCNYGITPLHYAVREGDAQAIDFLLAHGADVNAKAELEITPLFIAASRGDAELARRLLGQGAEVNERGARLAPLSHVAPEEGRAAIVLSQHARLTPLSRAAQGGHVAVVLELLDHGAGGGGDEESGVSALHLAVLGPNFSTDFEGQAEPPSADDRRDEWTLYQVSPLNSARADKYLETAQALLDHGAAVNGRDRLDHTPLHFAAWVGNGAMIEFLASKGADVNARDQYGQTALHLAAMMGDLDIARLLIQKGADPNAQDNNGRKPHELAGLSDARELMGK